jgi:glycosyltransferase involved in cell wall biosynthesis
MPERRPTILQIVPRLDAGGAELSAIEIAAALAAAGARAEVFTEGGRMADRIAAVGGVLVPFPAATKNPARIVANARALAHHIRTTGVDLVHARSRAPAWSALLAARWTGRPFVTTYHGAYNEKSALKRWYNGVMARGDIVIANSNFTRDLIVARYGTPAAKIRVIHRGIDPDVFDPARIPADAVAAMRTSWGVEPGQPVILLAARLTGWKGQTVLIDAAAHLAAEGQLGQAAVILAGDHQGRDDYVATLDAQIARLGLDGRVRRVGHVADMPTAIASATVAVIASTEPEAFGRSVAEAQAMGCPVVATAIGAPMETVAAPPAVSADAATGWLVPPGDPVLLAAAIREAMTLAPDARRALGDRARARMVIGFSLEAMKCATLAVYDELLGSRLLETYRSEAAGTRRVDPGA